MKNGFTKYTRYGPKDEEEYLLEIWRQPWVRWFKAYLYGKYWALYKVPGYKLIEHVVNTFDVIKRKLSRVNDDPWFNLPWSARQDIRWYSMKYRKREVIAVLTVTEEQFNMLKGHDE